MSRMDPERGCFDVGFSRAYALGESAELALEDYARALAGSGSLAQAIEAPGGDGRVSGIHVCGADPGSAAALRAEMEEFARDLALRSGRGGLGWE